MDGRPHGSMPRLLGDSRGRWEGETLVVDTINFTAQTSFRGSTRAPASRRTLHAHRRRHDRIHVHRRRLEHVDEAVDGGDHDDQHSRPDLPVRLPRRQRAERDWLAQRNARRRERQRTSEVGMTRRSRASRRRRPVGRRSSKPGRVSGRPRRVRPGGGDARSRHQRPPARTPDIHFVPTRQSVADAMLQLARVNANDVVYDLGSGDGRIVITAAQKYGARGVGIELDPQTGPDLARNRARRGGRTQGDLHRRRSLHSRHLSGHGGDALPLVDRQHAAGSEAQAGASPRRAHRVATLPHRLLEARRDRGCRG